MAEPASYEKFIASLSKEHIAELRELYAVQPQFPGNRLYTWFAAEGPLDNVLSSLDAFQLQLLEAMLVLGQGRRRDQIDEVIDGRATPDQVDAALAVLERLALAWPIDRVSWALNPGLPNLLRTPCGLGPPAWLLLEEATVAKLQGAARFFGVEPAPRKAGLVEQVTALMADPDRIRSAVASLSRPAQSLLTRLADPGGPLRLGWGMPVPAGAAELIDRALLVVVNYEIGIVPAEVALAMRGDRLLPTVSPVPPEVGELVAGDLSGRYAEAVARVVADMGRLLSAVSVRPLAQLASGGVGAKEQRRLAKELALPETTVSLLLCLAEDVEALTADAVAVLESPGSGFTAAAPANQWVAMALAFVTAPESFVGRVPFATRQGQGDGLPPGLALSLSPPSRKLSAADFESLIGWRLPRLRVDLTGELGESAVVALDQAAVLGLAVDGVVTDLVELAEGDPRAALPVIAALLPAQVEEVILQADLTATTTGPPGPALARLLDGAAESETRGHASVWRFSPASVRRYLGDGGDGDALLAALAEAAPRGVPDTVRQLVADAARRHGELEVRTAAAVVIARDAVTAATLLGDRKLAKLRLTQIAPTVLIAGVGEAAVIEAVRKAGYAPSTVSGGPQVVGPDLEKLVKSAMRGTPRAQITALLSAVRDGQAVRLKVWQGYDLLEVELTEPRIDASYISGRADGRTHRFKLANVATVL